MEDNLRGLSRKWRAWSDSWLRPGWSSSCRPTYVCVSGEIVITQNIIINSKNAMLCIWFKYILVNFYFANNKVLHLLNVIFFFAFHQYSYSHNLTTTIIEIIYKDYMLSLLRFPQHQNKVVSPVFELFIQLHSHISVIYGSANRTCTFSELKTPVLLLKYNERTKIKGVVHSKL